VQIARWAQRLPLAAAPPGDAAVFRLTTEGVAAADADGLPQGLCRHGAAQHPPHVLLPPGGADAPLVLQLPSPFHLALRCDLQRGAVRADQPGLAEDAAAVAHSLGGAVAPRFRLLHAGELRVLPKGLTAAALADAAQRMDWVTVVPPSLRRT
jgi:hypothetical protein